MAPTARPRRVLGGWAVSTRSNYALLPAESTGIATCLKRATGTARLALAGLRPCRLLPSPFPHVHSPFRRGGTIVLMGGAEIRTEAWMVRGTIVSLTPMQLLPTFSYACRYHPTFLRLY